LKQIPFISGPGEVEIPSLYFVESCDSTQDLIQDLINQDPTFSNTVACFTFNQVNGRGQGKNKWNDVPNQSVAYSIAIPLLDSLDLVLLNKYLTLKVLSALQTFSTESVFIKWPNDLICLNKKLSGLLMQIVSNKWGNRFIILGIGVNANQDNIQNYLPHAISLKDIVHKSIDLTSLTKYIHFTVSSGIQSLKTLLMNSNSEIAENFNSKLWGIGCEIYINIEDESIRNDIFNLVSGDGYSGSNQSELPRIQVKIIGVDPLGRLQFESNGKHFACHHGQIRIHYDN
jgi:BirA family biotin operon repressor/biotin-[acetyl-CoA-carboxylase] ligase